ncbi:MAG: lactate racemase domain-containing protein [Angelakisella sp.]
MELQFEYGQGFVKANLPDSTDVFIPGETVPDPPCLPQDKESLIAATRESVRNPIGMEPLSKLAKKGSKVTIIFPDRVKGGEQPTAHRKISIPVILEELYAAGVEKKDILLICSNGLHRKNTEKEILGVLGEELYNEFAPSHQIINHDSEDYDHLVDLGTTQRGDPVLMNKYVYDSDVAILIGHTQGNPYGGYSGGYKHCSTGITHWKSIASHHVPSVMHRKDFTPVSGSSLMRTKFDEIGMHMEEKMGKKFFCCDAVLDTKSRQIEINSGYAREMQPKSWETADKRTYVHWSEKKYDVMVFGMPQFFHYGDGMGTNPIMLMQALSAQVIRHKRIMSDNCVIICASTCNGYWNESLWPYLPELYKDFQTNNMNTLPDLNRLGEYYATNEEYIRKYRYANAFHPFHGFSMISCGHIAEMNTSAIYLCGTQEPGIARGMGLKTRATIEEALEDAKKKFVGENPNILALPRTFTTAAVHLCMKDPSQNSSTADMGNHPCCG